MCGQALEEMAEQKVKTEQDKLTPTSDNDNENLT